MRQLSTLDRLEVALWFRAPAPEDFKAEPMLKRQRAGVGLFSVLLAALLLTYHAHHSLAEVVQGSSSDENLVVSWEYDLEQGTGWIESENLNLMLYNQFAEIYFENLLPEQVDNLEFGYALREWECARDLVLASILPGSHSSLTFDFCDPVGGTPFLPSCEDVVAVAADANYGKGYAYEYRMGTSCIFFQVPIAPVRDFVTVQAVECVPSDTDHDGDVDLEDFAAFQRAFQQHLELFCLDGVEDDMTGPQDD